MVRQFSKFNVLRLLRETLNHMRLISDNFLRVVDIDLTNRMYIFIIGTDRFYHNMSYMHGR